MCSNLALAGCQVIAVHGRHLHPPRVDETASDAKARAVKRQGAADLAAIGSIRSAMRLNPAAAVNQCKIITNGNVRCPSDIIANLQSTSCDGLMVAEELLAYPPLFSEAKQLMQPADHNHIAEVTTPFAPIDLCNQYLSLIQESPPLQRPPHSQVVYHIRRMLQHQQLLTLHSECGMILDQSKCVDEVREMLDALYTRCIAAADDSNTPHSRSAHPLSPHQLAALNAYRQKQRDRAHRKANGIMNSKERYKYKQRMQRSSKHQEMVSIRLDKQQTS